MGLCSFTGLAGVSGPGSMVPLMRTIFSGALAALLLMVTLYAGLPCGIDAHKAALEVINARAQAPAASAA